MGLKEIYAPHRAAMRDDILRAARQLFVREGYRNVSIRKIAARIDYSPAAIYLYFRGKNDIFLALAEEGVQRFSRTLSAPRDEDDLLRALEDRFWRYYEFSKRQPEYFWLMFVDREVARLSRGGERFAPIQQAREDGISLVRRCVAAGLLPPGTNATAAFHVLATAIHGAALQRLSGLLSGRRLEPDQVARDALRAALAGLRAGVALEVRSEK